MADLTIPKGQTFPWIRGYVADDEGPLPLEEALGPISLVVDNTDGDPLALVVELAEETMTVSGQEYPVNWKADYSESALSGDTTAWRGKLKVQWDEEGRYVQYCPKDGFVEIEITPNVTEAEAP